MSDAYWPVPTDFQRAYELRKEVDEVIFNALKETVGKDWEYRQSIEREVAKAQQVGYDSFGLDYELVELEEYKNRCHQFHAEYGCEAMAEAPIFWNARWPIFVRSANVTVPHVREYDE